MASYDTRSFTFFAADFRPDFGTKLPLCADLVYKKYKPDDVAFRPGMSYTFKWWGERKLSILTNTRFACQTLGLDVWRGGISEFAGATKDVLEALEVTQLKRIGFKLVTLVGQKMTHSELSDLFFGTYLCPVDEWSSICSTPTDPLVQVSGKVADMKCLANFTAMTTEQAEKFVSSIPNVEHFGKNPIDPVISKFAEIFTSGTALMIDIDLSREDLPASDSDRFIKNSLKSADELIDASLAKLLSKPKQ